MNAQPEWMMYAHALLALIFVMGLIFLCAGLAKKFGLDSRMSGMKRVPRRLRIVETLYIDPRNRLVMVRRDEKEHLLLIGASGPLLVESFEKDKADV